MIWKIARPQFWILDRQVRRMPRFVIPVVILLLGLGGQWLYSQFLQEKLDVLNSEHGVAAVASFLPSFLFVFLFTAIVGLGDILYQLYLASDLELLMATPIPNRAIFVVKLMQCSRVTVLPAILAGGLLVALGLAQGANIGYYLLIILLLLTAMTLVTAVMISLVILLGRLIPPEKARAWLPLALVLLSLLVLPLQQPALGWFMQQGELLTFLSQALVDLEQLAILVASFGGAALALSLVTYQIFDRAFHNGWSRFQVVSFRRPARRRSRLARWMRPLPAPLRFIMEKEWLTLRRTPQGLVNLAQSLMMGVVVATFAVAGGPTIRPALFWFMLIFLGLYLTMAGNAAQTSLALEGRNLALLRSAPIEAEAIVRGKFWAIWIPNLLTWSLIILAFGLLFGLPGGEIALLLLIAGWGMTGASVTAVALGALTLDFAVDDPRKRLPGPVSWLMVGLSSVFTVLTIAGALWLLVHLAPPSNLSAQMEALAGFGIVRALLSDGANLPLLLGGGQMLFWIGLRALWAAGVRRLDQYEEV